MPAKTCVILPAFNSEKTVGQLVREVKRLGLDPIVVNDGSVDGTAKMAMDAGAFVMSHLGNRGKGLALRTGFSYALHVGYESIVTMDSDGQHDPADLPKLIEAGAQPQAAIVVGHRMLERGSMPAARWTTNRMMSWIISRLTRQQIPDSQCGFRVIRREVLEAVRLSTDHYDLETELLLASARHGWRIVSVPIRTIYHADHSSHIRPIIDAWRFMCLVIRYLLEPRRTQRQDHEPLRS